MENSDWTLLVITGGIMAAATLGHIAGIMFA